MSQLWKPDRTLTREGAQALVRASLPTIESRDLRFLGCGWEFDAYLSADGWVVRFPRRAEAAALFDKEQRVHGLLDGVLPAAIAVPRVELRGQPATGFPYEIAAHRYIPGVPIDELAGPLLPLSPQIGSVLGAIHSVPEEAARVAGVEAAQVGDEGGRAWIAQGLEALSSLRGTDPTIARAARWVEEASIPVEGFSFPLRFIHQDLSPEHVLADPTTGQLTGILDWTDAMLGDAARDFVFVVAWGGWAFAEDVLRHYPHPVDPGFRDRLRFMARFLTPLWLGWAHERGTEVEKLTTWVHNAYAPELHTLRTRSR